MIPKEKKTTFIQPSNFLPKNLLEEDDDDDRYDDNDPTEDDQNKNCIFEDEDPDYENPMFYQQEPQLHNPKTYNSDNNLLRQYHNNNYMQYSPQNNSNNNINYSYNNHYYPQQHQHYQQQQMYYNMPNYSNQSYNHYSNNMSGMSLQYELHNQLYQNQMMHSKLSQKYFDQMNSPQYIMHSNSYIANESIKTMYDSDSSEREDQTHHPIRKFNSSGNILVDSRQGIGNKKNKKSNKRKRSSLFTNKTEEKSDSDVRDFKRFCDGVKCELDLYICSQIGSRIMQKYLNKFPAEIVTLLINKISNHIPKIMVDVYGNYFCQKLIAKATPEQRILILNSIQHSFCDIAKAEAGTHVLQTLLDIEKQNEEEEIILKSIETHELEMAFHVNATHVLEKIILTIDEFKRPHLNQLILANLKELCLDRHGLCIAKKFIFRVTSNEIFTLVTETITKDFIEIAESPYGNYAIQHLIDEWKAENSSLILQLIITNIAGLSMQRYSANIVEKIISQLSEENKTKIFNELFNYTKINGLINNKYGKFVLKKCINVMTKEQKELIHKDYADKVNDASLKGKKKMNSIMDLFNDDE